MPPESQPLRAQRGIGVIVPADMALDRELWRWTPPDVSLFVTRLPATAPVVTLETVSAMGDPALVVPAVGELLPAEPVATLYACTSGSFVRGAAGEQQLVEVLESAGAPQVFTTSGAVLAALRHLDVTAVSIATPYDAAITQRLAAYLDESGVRVVSTSYLGLNSHMWEVPYVETAELVRAADHPDAEAILVSCTNLPTYDLVSQLEDELGKPVVTANQASMWAVLRLLGRNAAGDGQRLLATEPIHEERPTAQRTERAKVAGHDQPPARQSLPPDEHAHRLSRVQAAMSARSLSALVVSDPANIYYLTGYDAWSFYTPQCLVVPPSGEPHFFARAMDAAGAAGISALRPDQVHGYPESLVHQPDVHPYEWIVEQARDTGLLGDDPELVVAVEGDAHFFSPRGYLALAAGIPSATVVDSRELVNWVRLVKSEAEQRRLRLAGKVAEQAMRVALDEVDVGRRQCDVAAAVLAAQARGTSDHGGDYPAIVPMMPTGASAGTPHLTWNDAPLVAGEAMTIELAGAFDRYHAPLARTVMLGTPPKQLADTAAVITDAMAASLAAAKPGSTGTDVHAAFNAVIAQHGLTKESRCGYSIGIGYPPDWGERTVSLRGGEQTMLEPGMAFHVILGIWMDGWGYELSEPVLVTDAGAERLTHLPQELTVRK